eukprot:2239134-Rhodomonas_salina.1
MELYHVPTHEQAADCFMKSLPSKVLKKHQTLLAGEEENAARVPGAQVNSSKADEAYAFYAGAGKEETFYSTLKSSIVGRGDLGLELEE